MKKNNTTLPLLALSLFFFGVVAIGFVYEIYQFVEARKEIATSEIELDGEESSLASFLKLTKTASKIKTDGERAHSFFIKREDVADFLGKIEGVSFFTSTKVSEESVTEKKVDTQKFIAVRVLVEGTYSQVYHAIQSFEKLPYQMEIQGVTLSKKEGEKSAWSAHVDIVGVMQ